MKKLSQKEKGEVVTKGYLQDQDFATKGWIEEQDFVTKGWIENQNFATKIWIENQNFATKSYVSDMFEMFEKKIVQEIKQEFKQEFRQHTTALMESYAHQTQLIVEALVSRIERIERHVGLPSF